MCGTYTPPKVLSVSYGGPEQGFSASYVQRQCNEWMKLALQGTTTVVSSGDYGVGGYPGATNNTDNCYGDGSVFAPDWFATCPYVLSVGGTEIRPNVSGLAANPEQAVFAQFTGETLPYTSGGGFSNVFARPPYQDTAVTGYYKTAQPSFPYYSTTNGKDIGKNGGVYNRAGRGFPDVSRRPPRPKCHASNNNTGCCERRLVGCIPWREALSLRRHVYERPDIRFRAQPGESHYGHLPRDVYPHLRTLTNF